ncbi:helix-turn-helix domain-containing protein [Scandinavium goeteborgense]|uniref:Helix-turn-helix protein n=1 Tax=Scandinavium goeteborgense TaxID=1851514 RepID=A0A4R6DSL9_SCAGO|nr:helix-turn-helix transcriptional regulator [Scandinavium goeteborgense]TDN48086.1 hypothetical protein EC847_12837 [Scandinavium goeteborgense]
MTGFDLKLWRRGMLWTQSQAAKEFGITRRTWIRYEQSNPPKVIIYAIQGMSLLELAASMPGLTNPCLRSRINTIAYSLTETIKSGEVS